MRVRSWVVSWVVALAFVAVGAWRLAGPAAAEPVRFGYTGIHATSADRWESLRNGEDGAVLDFLQQRAELAARLGASVVRLGDAEPHLVDFDALHEDEHRDWHLLDATTVAFTEAGLELCLTVPKLIAGEDTGTYEEFVRRLAERYDGDDDLGPEDQADFKQHEFPNVDGPPPWRPWKGPNVNDWQASEDTQLAWAEAHRMALVEPGVAPYRAEEEGALTPEEYGQQLQITRNATEAAESDALGVKLAETRLEGQSREGFVDRLASLPDSGAPWFDVASADVRGFAGELIQRDAAEALGRLAEWLGEAEVGHPDAALWLGGLRFAPGGLDDDRCNGSSCRERLRAGRLVRAVMGALVRGYRTLLYRRPAVRAEGEGSSGALVHLAGSDGDDGPTANPTPSYAVWRGLRERLGGVASEALEPIDELPSNVRGVRVGERGWLLAWDWTRDVQPGAAPPDETKRVELSDVQSAGLRVVRLWPEPDSVGEALDEQGRTGASRPERTIDVGDGGRAAFDLGPDPVWVEPAAAPRPDGAADAAGDAAGDLGPDAGSGGGGGGCTTGPGGTLPLALSVLLAGGMLRRRRTGHAVRPR